MTGTTMPIYAVVSMPPDALVDEIQKIPERDRHELAPGAWFIRSPFVTTEQVKNSLGIEVGGPNGIVAATSRYTGVADRELVEKLQVWEGME